MLASNKMNHFAFDSKVWPFCGFHQLSFSLVCFFFNPEAEGGEELKIYWTLLWLWLLWGINCTFLVHLLQAQWDTSTFSTMKEPIARWVLLPNNSIHKKLKSDALKFKPILLNNSTNVLNGSQWNSYLVSALNYWEVEWFLWLVFFPSFLSHAQKIKYIYIEDFPVVYRRVLWDFPLKYLINLGKEMNVQMNWNCSRGFFHYHLSFDLQE